MVTMSIQDWGAVGELIGALAVLFTLLYLALQVRQSNLATHRSMYANAAEAIADFWMELAKNPALYDSYRACLRDAQGISSEERERGWLVLDAYMSLMESYYLHNRAYGEVLSEQRWTRTLTHLLNLPGGRRYWKTRRIAFHEDFAVYVDAMVDDEVLTDPPTQ